MDIIRVKEILKKHEGLRLKPYCDTVGKLTIGYGRNLDDNGITEKEADHLLMNDLMNAVDEARHRVPGFSNLNDVRQAVVVNMVFNLGITRFLTFKKTIAAMLRGDFLTASFEMLDSRWARQVGRRSRELAAMMESGKWELDIEIFDIR